MRPWLPLALLALVPSASAGAVAFGEPGAPRFDPFPLPESLANARNAGEPTIGIPWATDHVFFQAYASTHRAAFADRPDGTPAAVQWDDVSPDFTPFNGDPMLHADPVTGRVWAGGLAGPCSLMGISDDDGATWVPAGNMCSGAQFDHQSIGSGPWRSGDVPQDALYPRAVHYCAQLGRTACATSLDGGLTFLPFTEVLGGCGGLHGHIEVSPQGFAAVPHGGCSAGEQNLLEGDRVGFAYTEDNGLTWSSRVMAESLDGEGFDPAVAFSLESGWMWLAQADAEGIHVALSKDEGLSWEMLGGATPGAQPATWLDLGGTFRDPATGHPLVFGAFPDLEAGDDGRVALAFLGTTNPAGQEPFSPPTTAPAPFAPGECSDVADGNVWHYYLAQSFDGGQGWTTTRLWEDPVQVGAIWNAGGSESCRNLLDFNDMDMDSQGRLSIAFADGCTGACPEKYFAWVNGTGPAPAGSDSRDAWGTVLRQATGLGLLSAYDRNATAGPGPDGDETGRDEGTPGLGLAAIGLAMLASAGWRRRQRGSWS